MRYFDEKFKGQAFRDDILETCTFEGNFSVSRCLLISCRIPSIKDWDIYKTAFIDCDGIFQVGGLGSMGRTVTYSMNDDLVIAGCFRGSLAEFERVVKVKKRKSKIHKSYLGAIKSWKLMKKLREKGKA